MRVDGRGRGSVVRQINDRPSRSTDRYFCAGFALYWRVRRAVVAREVYDLAYGEGERFPLHIRRWLTEIVCQPRLDVAHLVLGEGWSNVRWKTEKEDEN